VFHLTRYRYIFFAISAVVIVPGLLALIFWHLNLGIDFTNGTTITLRLARSNVTTAQIQQAFTKAGAQDVQVFAATSTGAQSPGQFAYIQFSRPIGKSEEAAVKQRLSDPKAGLPAINNDGSETIYQMTFPKSGDQSALMVVQFAQPVEASKVEAALQNLPPTDAPPVGATTTPGSTATPSASATTTPGAHATATPGATATPASTPGASASSGSSSSTSPTFPVTVTSVTAGTNAQTYQVETQTALVGPKLDNIVFGLNELYGPAYVLEHQEVSPAIASETTVRAIFAVALAALAILLYIGIAFHKVGSWQLSFRFGASAIIALLHDAFVVLGLWAIFGRLFDFKVDTLFLTAVLTVIGFSVHDTIVVFDRIRENLQRRTSESFTTVVDTSLIQTMSRSLNTSLTVLFTLAALTLFGGDSTREFTLALLIGIASGTYSSIFNASMILVVWQTGEYKTWFRRGGGQKARPAQRTRDLAPTRA
jgi:preprotein translocase SecF subunit